MARMILRAGIQLGCLQLASSSLGGCESALVLHAEQLAAHAATIASQQATISDLVATIADLVRRLQDVEGALFRTEPTSASSRMLPHEGHHNLLFTTPCDEGTKIDNCQITSTTINGNDARIGFLNVTDVHIQGSLYYRGEYWSPHMPSSLPTPPPSLQPTTHPTRQPTAEPTTVLEATLTSSYSSYQRSTMAVNSVVWNDRTYKYTSVPSGYGLVGALLFQGPHDLPSGVSISITSHRSTALKVFVFAGVGGTTRDAGFSSTMNNINGWTNYGPKAGPPWEGNAMGMYSYDLSPKGTVTLPTTSSFSDNNCVGIAVV